MKVGRKVGGERESAIRRGYNLKKRWERENRKLTQFSHAMQIPFLLYFSLTHSLSLSLSLSRFPSPRSKARDKGGGITEWFLQSLKIFLKIWKKVAALPICSLSVKKLLLLHHHVHSVSSLCFGHHHHQGFATHNLSLSLFLFLTLPLSLFHLFSNFHSSTVTFGFDILLLTSFCAFILTFLFSQN